MTAALTPVLAQTQKRHTSIRARTWVVVLVNTIASAKPGGLELPATRMCVM